MDVSIIASAPRELFIHSSATPLGFRLPHRRPWRLSDSPQSWNCLKGKSDSCKTVTARKPHLITNISEPSKSHDYSYPFQNFQINVHRRTILPFTAVLLSTSLLYDTLYEANAMASDFADMPALRGKDYGKPKMRYPDYRETESGLQYKDLRIGTGSSPKIGETVVVDWDGYTIGYYGRIFEARNKPKGGSFEGNEKGYFRFTMGNHEVIPAFEEAVLTMNIGGVRRIIVPPELGYPENDFTKRGPKPTTFSGQRALDFVLKNQGLIDKTLLFDIELLKISAT